MPWLERQAEQGNEAAISALRGLRYRAQRAQNQQKAGFDGEDLGSSKPQKEPTQSNSINGENHADHFNIRNAQLRITLDHKVEYLDNKGTVRLTDAGPRIDLSQENDLEAMRAGLQLASQKYGGEVFITGSLPFREFAAKEALDMGIKVRNQELNHIKKQVEIKIETEFER